MLGFNGLSLWGSILSLGGYAPFNQDGATLDLSFVGTAGNLSGADTYTLNTDFITPEYQVAAQYAVWENGVGLAQKTFSQIVTFTRASTATYFNSAGTLTTATTNEARFDHNPSTLVPLGFLIEEQRTNSIRNNTMQGAVAGTPGTLPTNWSTFTTLTGLTRTVVGAGTENGVTYVDIRLNGTPSAAGIYGIYFEGSTQVAAANGQNWTSSAYIKLSGGSLTGISTVNYVVAELNNVGGFLASSTTAATPTGSALSTQRTVVSRTFNQATTAFALPYIDLVLSGAAIDITLRIGLPQLEQGAFATSVIPTTTTALTRSADVASVNTLSPWFNASEGTLFGEGSPLRAPLTAAGIPMSFTSINNEIALRFRPTQKGGASVVNNSVVQVDTASTGNYTTGNNKLAFAYAVNDFASSLNGESAVVDTLGTVPVVTSMTIGSLSGVANWTNGYIRRITYYPRRLSNADLQTITA